MTSPRVFRADDGPRIKYHFEGRPSSTTCGVGAVIEREMWTDPSLVEPPERCNRDGCRQKWDAHSAALILTPHELDLLATDIDVLLADHDYPIHADAAAIRPHLPAFLAAVLRSAAR